MRRVLPLTLLSLLLLASPAGAAQISFSGSTVTYTAGPGESNRALASTSPYDTSCTPVTAPCFKLSDSGARPVVQFVIESSLSTGTSS